MSTGRRSKNRRVISENQNDSESRGTALHHLRPSGTVCESFSSTEMIFMIDLETHARIRRLFYAEHWKNGTISRELGLSVKTLPYRPDGYEGEADITLLLSAKANFPETLC